jgi:hypothetical protein
MPGPTRRAPVPPSGGGRAARRAAPALGHGLRHRARAPPPRPPVRPRRRPPAARAARVGPEAGPASASYPLQLLFPAGVSARASLTPCGPCTAGRQRTGRGRAGPARPRARRAPADHLRPGAPPRPPRPAAGRVPLGRGAADATARPQRQRRSRPCRDTPAAIHSAVEPRCPRALLKAAAGPPAPPLTAARSLARSLAQAAPFIFPPPAYRGWVPLPPLPGAALPSRTAAAVDRHRPAPPSGGPHGDLAVPAAMSSARLTARAPGQVTAVLQSGAYVPEGVGGGHGALGRRLGVEVAVLDHRLAASGLLSPAAAAAAAGSVFTPPGSPERATAAPSPGPRCPDLVRHSRPRPVSVCRGVPQCVSLVSLPRSVPLADGGGRGGRTSPRARCSPARTGCRARWEWPPPPRSLPAAD